MGDASHEVDGGTPARKGWRGRYAAQEISLIRRLSIEVVEVSDGKSMHPGALVVGLGAPAAIFPALEKIPIAVAWRLSGVLL